MNGNFSHCSICEGDHDIENCPRVAALRASSGSVLVCRCCGRRMKRRQGRAPEYCWAPKCQKAKKAARRKADKTRVKQIMGPAATTDELMCAYHEGYENGKRPDTEGPEDNPHMWKSNKKARTLAAEWARGWTDGAEAFCNARDNARNTQVEPRHE